MDRDGSLAALEDRSSLFGLDPKTLQPTSAVHLADEKGADLDSAGLVIDLPHSRLRSSAGTSIGTLLMSSETEPSVRRYFRDGKILDRLPVPSSLLVAPAGRAGKNLTFEGLTMLPGGRTLPASMEDSIGRLKVLLVSDDNQNQAQTTRANTCGMRLTSAVVLLQRDEIRTC